MGTKEIPVSNHARNQLSEDWVKYWGVALGISILACPVFLIVPAHLNLLVLLAITLVVLGAWAISELIGGKAWRRNRADILSQNEADYNRSLQLKDCLWGFEATQLSNLSVKVPNLLDASFILFLESTNDIRVFVSDPRASHELLVKIIKLLLSEIPKDSHTFPVLREFLATDNHLLNPISHPQLIDSLDASCEMCAGERPNVGVIGEKIQGCDACHGS